MKWKQSVRAEGIVELAFYPSESSGNALRLSDLEELNDLLRELSKDREMRLLVLRSGTPGIFSESTEPAELRGIEDASAGEEFSATGQQIMDRIEALPFPSLAAINGSCADAGLELALACNYRIATEEHHTVFGFSQTELGVLPGFGGTQRLPRLVGAAKALPLIVLGKRLTTDQALEIGLVDTPAAESFFEETIGEFIDRVVHRRGRRAIARRRESRRRGTRLLERTGPGRKLVYNRVRRQIMADYGENYPAPLEALEVVRKGMSSSMHRGLALERETFGRVVASRATKNLLHLAWSRNELARAAGEREAGTLEHGPYRPESGAVGHGAAQLDGGNVAVLGAGVTGARVAWLCSHAGVPVALKDRTWERIAAGYATVARIYDDMRERRAIDRRSVGMSMHRIHAGTEDYILRRADIVLEALPEDLSLKRSVLAQLESVLSERTTIATNTSSCTVEEIAAGLERPGRLAAMQFFHPADRTPLVEIAAGSNTEPDTVDTLRVLARRLGKVSIVVGDRPGFLVNRLMYAFLNEAAVLVEEGVEFERVDRVFEEFGFASGPFRLIDGMGIDTASSVLKILAKSYGERLAPSSLLPEIAERLRVFGKKSGEGFYRHGASENGNPNNDVRALIAERFPHRSNLIDEDVLRRPLYMMLNEASRCLEEAIVAEPYVIDAAIVMTGGFPPFRGGIFRWADELEPSEVNKTLKEYSRRYGTRYNPPEFLKELGEKGRFFYRRKP